jgi:hypothetical protein
MNEHFKQDFNKDIVKGVMLVMVVATVYLAFAFILMETNPAKWELATRALFVLFSFGISACAALIAWGGR